MPPLTLPSPSLLSTRMTTATKHVPYNTRFYYHGNITTITPKVLSVFLVSRHSICLSNYKEDPNQPATIAPIISKFSNSVMHTFITASQNVQPHVVHFWDIVTIKFINLVICCNILHPLLFFLPITRMVKSVCVWPISSVF